MCISRYRQWNAISSLAAITLLVLHLFVLSWFSLTKPMYIWDVIPYVATTFTPDSDDSAAIHTATYDLLKQSLDVAQFNSLISGKYPAAMHANPENFAEQLSMYEIKPLYVLALRALAAAGANPVDGIIWLSLVSSLLICVILFLWLRQLTGPMQAALTVILFSLAARMFDLSQGSVPDSFSALALIAGLWCLLARHWAAGATLCFCLSIWIRINNILFVGPLFLLLCYNHLYLRGGHPSGKDIYWYSGGLALSILSYFWISTVFDYNWWRLFYHTLVELQIEIGSFAEPFSITVYLDVLRGAAVQFLARGGVFPTVLPLFLLLWLITWSANWRDNVTAIFRPTRPISLADASALCFPVFGAFFVLFPLVSELDRFFTPYYAIITVYAVSRISELRYQTTVRSGC